MQLTDAARGRAHVERWCALAEQRLDYLAELFETGRWRRFFAERAFLENIQDAKAAVETWRGLLDRQVAGEQPVDLSWLGRQPTPPTRPLAPAAVVAAALAETAAAPDLDPAQPQALLADDAAAICADPAPKHLKIVAVAEPEPEPEPAPSAAIEPDESDWQRALDPMLLRQRYPLLRRAS